MTTTTMSIHQGLAELKLLESRILNATNKGTFVAHVVASKKDVGGYKTVEDFEAGVKAAFQSVTDLISRRDKIKGAIVRSNATTTVEIGDEKMTVADAIERKKTIEFRKNLLRKLSSDLAAAVREVDKVNDAIPARIDELLKISLGAERKGREEDAAILSKNFRADNSATLADPLDVRKVIAKLEEEIETFLTQVDFRLSESNTLTKIEV